MHIPFKAPAEYQFSYDVKDDYSKNDFGHSEDRSGYNTKGQYQVSQALSPILLVLHIGNRNM